MNINKRQFLIIQKVIKSRVKSVKLNKTWISINKEYNIGRIVSGNLHLSIDDLDFLRLMVQRSLSIDPLYDDIQGDRLNLASRTRNEKISGAQVFGNYLQVSRAGNLPIPRKYGDAITPRNTILSVIDGELNLESIPSILLIENGTTFLYWSSLKLPDECFDSVIIYRGHGESSKAAHRLLNKRPSSCLLYTFFDFDPSGVAMALRLDADGVVIPLDYRTINEDVETMRLNKVETYWTQWMKESEYLSINCPKNLELTLRCMKNYDIALTQESIMARNLSLKLINLKS